MPLLVDPLPPGDRRLLRTAVLTLARTEHRHAYPAMLHVGTPGGPTVTVTDDRGWDHGLRTDLVGAVLRLLDDPPWVWLTRAGSLELQDVDVAWLGATLAAARERGSDPAFVVVTRHGWRDPRSGTGQRWRRIRQR